MAKLNLVIVLGTTREDNKSQHVAKYLTDFANKGGDFKATLFDPADASIAHDGEKDPAYTKLTEEADAFLFVVPEYNHGYPGTLKLVIDSELKNYIHKPAAVAGVSAGRYGGVRAIVNLMPVIREVGLSPTFTDITVSDSYNEFDETGAPKSDYVESQAKAALTELAWMARTLQWGRQNLESKYHEDDK